MPGKHTIKLEPLGVSFKVRHGTPLQDVLFAHGVEFPCGGRKRCKGCKVRVLSGTLPASEEEKRLLSATELAGGWRLACCGVAGSDLELELAQWEASVLSDSSSFEFTPREGYGIAVDIGTTTIVAQLLDLSTGNVLSVKTALNRQAQYGADIMERINYSLSPERKADLSDVLRRQTEAIVSEAVTSARVPEASLRNVVLVGNTVMQHFFCGFDIAPLAHVPFEPEPPAYEITSFRPQDLGWKLPATVTLSFLPCLGSFVGSDVLAGILATGIHERNEYAGLIDLGTNGEIVIGNRDRMLCASTAAGPAFEGARISMGMRASTGAIASVAQHDGEIRYLVIGGGRPRGICGSGLVDAVAVGLRMGRIRPNGRLTGGNGVWEVAAPVSLSQADIRELQLAKGAIAAGIQILLGRMELSAGRLAGISLAGAFGNYINRESALEIGLLPFPVDRIKPVGNAALLGAKRSLFMDETDEIHAIQQAMEHVPLSANPRFMDIFAGEMLFPEA